MKKFFACFLTTLLCAGLLTGCSGDGGNTGESISLLNSKGEIQSALEEVAKEYQQKTGVKIEIIACPAGTSPFQTISANYNAGVPPTMAMLDTTDILALGPEKAVDLTGESWVADAGDLAYYIGGKVYSFPTGAESKGLIYNKTAIEETLGQPFDPSQYKTLDQFEELLKSLVENGMESPVVVSKEDWSLGAHFAALIYESQSMEPDEVNRFIEELKAGNVDLADNARFSQVMDLFDLLREYNINKADPLGADYAVDPNFLAEGESAFWFNGNWAWPNIQEFAGEDTEFGLMAAPLNNDEADPVNTTLIGIGTKQIMIDKEKATPSQQQAAKDFLNWLAFDEEGQKAMVEKLNFVPVFRSNNMLPPDGLGISIKSYLEAGKAVFGPVLPADHWASVGASMQNYLAGKITRPQLAEEIERYWKGRS